MSKCLIITSSYPFGPGEAFFKSELEEIAKEFSSVDLMPVRARGDIQRDIPGNVRCLKPLLTSRIKDVANILTSLESTIRHFIRIHKIQLPIVELLNCLRLGAAATRRRSQLAKSRYDLIYLYWGFPFSAVLVPLSGLAPRVQRFHGSDIWGSSGGSELHHGIEAYAGEAQVVFLSSQRGKDLLAATGKFSQEKLLVRYLGSGDQGIFSKTPFSEGLSISSNAFLTEGKRIELIAQTVNALSHQVPVSWTHVGGGSPEQIERLRQLAGAKARVSLCGTIHHSQLQAVLRKARPNLHLSLSRSEGLAINVLEAMSADIPVISSDVGAMREAVTPQAGLLVNEPLCTDPEELAKMILVETQPDGRLTKVSPREVWLRLFDARKNAKEFAQELKKIANEGGVANAVERP